jgi:hypothetical protein
MKFCRIPLKPHLLHSLMLNLYLSVMHKISGKEALALLWFNAKNRHGILHDIFIPCIFNVYAYL